jgi:hypothetical protein
VKRQKQLLRGLVFLLVFVALAGPLAAQTNPAIEGLSVSFDMTGFPLWAKDLRRAEIVAFGSFPFTMFTATFFMDTARLAQHDYDTKYAPWPFKSAGAIDMTDDEHMIVLAAAGIGSIAISLADFTIEQIKRYKVKQRALRLPQGTPIITRTPLVNGAVENGSSDEAGAAEQPAD